MEINLDVHLSGSSGASAEAKQVTFGKNWQTHNILRVFFLYVSKIL